MEIGLEQKNWEQVVQNGERYLAVYPMLSALYWRLGRADEELGRAEQAVQAYQRLLLLEPSDPVEVNYRLARLLQQRDPVAGEEVHPGGPRRRPALS